jgi:tetratricopeptide (TPR) repeat protein
MHGWGAWKEREDLFRKALSLDPYDPQASFRYGDMLLSLGYLKEALQAYERARLVEPLVQVYSIFRAQTLGATGMVEPAVDEFLRAGGGRRNGDFQFLAPAYAKLGRFSEAVDALFDGGGSQTRRTSGLYTKPMFEAAAQVLRAAANKTEPPRELPDFDSELAFVYAYTSTPERILDGLEKVVEAGGPFSGSILRDVWWLTPSSVRKTERFKAIVRKTAVVNVWRERGWPDLCHPTIGDDFECD